MATITDIAPFLMWGLPAYLLGAIPCGYLLARLKGVDIRMVGSGNIGATNVFRSVGKPLGVVTFILDALKGFIPAWVFPRLAGASAGESSLALVCAGLAIVGHTWPVYLRFKGGKGVATSAGALLGLAPAALGIGLVVWLVVFIITRYVSVASMLAAGAVTAAAWFLYACGKTGAAIPWMLTVLAAVIIWRHHSNMRRLRNGTEHRFQFGKGAP